MEEETEALDWGQEEDERQEANRMAALDQDSRRDFSDGDDVEDTVSLGEDEDEPVYYNQHQHATRNAYNASPAIEVPDRPPSSQRRADNMGANDQRGYHHNSREFEPLETSTSRDSRLSMDSPARQRYSTRHSSPQRSLQNGVRITHALPPKPAVASVLCLPPSHPSMVEAVGMASTSISPPNRTAMRDPKKVNGTPGKTGSSPMPADLPPDWEKRSSRQGGHPHYHSRETDETPWDFPVSNTSTTTYGGSQRRRRRSASPGNMHIIPPDSNTHHSQTSRSKPVSSQSRRESSLEGRPRSLTPDLGELSYEDRHYRPGGDPPATDVEMQPPERNEGVPTRLGPKSRYDRSPGMSPPRQRRRPRSISPSPDSRGPRVAPKENDYPSLRGNARSARDRNAFTNMEHPVSRNLESATVESEYSDRHYMPSPHLPPSDFSRNDRGSRRPPHRPNDDDDFMLEPRSSDNRNRQPLRRRDSSRGPRDREPPRPSERRDKPSENQGFISAPTRYRSPPRTREREPGRDYGPPSDVGPHLAPNPQLHRERDRPRFDQPNSSSLPLPARPPPRDPSDGWPRNNEQPRVREERDVVRGRRDPPPSDNANSRPQDVYPEEPSRVTNERPQRFPESYSQVPSEESLFRNRRAPLPPQNKTFYSSIVPGHHRDPVPYAPGWANGDPTLPKEPRYAPNDPIRNQAKPQPDRSQINQSAVGQRPPPIDTRMGVTHNKSQNPSDLPYARSKPLDTANDFPEASRPRADRLPPNMRRPPSNQMGPVPSADTSNTGPDSARVGTYSGFPPQTSYGDRQNQDRQNQERQNQNQNQERQNQDRQNQDRQNRERQNQERQNQERQNQERQNQERQNQERQNQERQNQERQNQERQNQERQNQERHNQERQNQERQNQERQNQERQDRQNQDKKDLERQNRDRQNQDNQHDVRPGWKETRPGNMYPERNPPPPRRENRGRPDDMARPPQAGPVSGTNNVPIGSRRPQATLLAPVHDDGPAAPLYEALPPTFNPSARPPPSTLINPAKARELPPGKESYERPPQLTNSYGQSLPDIDVELPRRERPPHTVEIPQKLSVELTEKPKRRRESRFSPIETRTKGDQPARLPEDDKRSRADNTIIPRTDNGKASKQATPPPISREPSAISVTTGLLSSRLSDPGPISDTEASRSVASRGPSTFSDANEPSSRNVSVRGEMTPPLSSVQMTSSERSFKPTQQRGGSKWGADARLISEQSSSLPQAVQPESPPTLARRMSSEKPPRLRKFPSVSPNIPVVDYDLRGDNFKSHQSFANVSDDLKDRLDRPTLLDRLQAPAPESENQPTLRERLVPSKRDRDDLEDAPSRDMSYDNEDGNDSKRPRRRTTKGRRGGGRRTMS